MRKNRLLLKRERMKSLFRYSRTTCTEQIKIKQTRVILFPPLPLPWSYYRLRFLETLKEACVSDLTRTYRNQASFSDSLMGKCSNFPSTSVMEVLRALLQFNFSFFISQLVLGEFLMIWWQPLGSTYKHWVFCVIVLSSIHHFLFF